MRDPVKDDGVETGIAEHDLQPRPRRRVTLHHPSDFFIQILEHFAVHPFIMLRLPIAGARAHAATGHAS